MNRANRAAKRRHKTYLSRAGLDLGREEKRLARSKAYPRFAIFGALNGKEISEGSLALVESSVVPVVGRGLRS
jgi:hypothetical protein